MLREAITKWSLLVATALILMMNSCAEKKKVNPEAQALLDRAKEVMNTDPAQAITLLDSLCKVYPGELTLVRDSIYLTTLAQENFINAEIATNDSIISADSVEYVRLKPQFVRVKEKDMVEAYYVHKSLKGNPLFARTGIEARYYESSDLVVVSMLRGTKANHTHLTVQCSAGSASTKDVPYDKSRNYRYNDDGTNTEMVTFHQEECEEFCQFFAENEKAKSMRVMFVGSGKQTMTVNDVLKHAIAETYRFAKAEQGGRDAVAKKIKLQKMKELNAQHKSRTAETLTKE